MAAKRCPRRWYYQRSARAAARTRPLKAAAANFPVNKLNHYKVQISTIDLILKRPLIKGQRTRWYYQLIG
jgi:hypothetical protein